MSIHDYRVVRKDVVDEIHARMGNGSMYVWLEDVQSDLDGTWVKVKSLPAAAEVCRGYIEARGMGSSSWNGGDVVVRSETQPEPALQQLRDRNLLSYSFYACSVAYNGRIFGSPLSEEATEAFVIVERV